MISKKEVKNIAKLARLDLSEKEIKRYQKELSKILDYIEKLKEVNVDKIDPMTYPIPIKNVFKRDEEKKEIIDQKKKILDLMPETKNGYLKVNPIFE